MLLQMRFHPIILSDSSGLSQCGWSLIECSFIWRILHISTKLPISVHKMPLQVKEIVLFYFSTETEFSFYDVLLWKSDHIPISSLLLPLKRIQDLFLMNVLLKCVCLWTMPNCFITMWIYTYISMLCSSAPIWPRMKMMIDQSITSADLLY